MRRGPPDSPTVEEEKADAFFLPMMCVVFLACLAFVLTMVCLKTYTYAQTQGTRLEGSVENDGNASTIDEDERSMRQDTEDEAEPAILGDDEDSIQDSDEDGG